MSTRLFLLQELEYFLTPEDLQELEDTIHKVDSSGISLEAVTKQDFPLPTLGPKLKAIHDDLLFGRGIRVLKGLPLGPPHSQRCFTPGPHCCWTVTCLAAVAA